MANHFSKIGEALQYIDSHLEEPITLELLAERFSFSPYYFHRLFSAIVGESLAAYIRERRILYACKELASTDRKLLDIALDLGFQSAQAFSRAFSKAQGLSPSEYRRQKLRPELVTTEELIMKFTNRLRGGILLNPNIITRKSMLIAGVSGDGNRTAEVWGSFMKLSGEKPLSNTESQNSYEIRLYDGEKCTVHVGLPVLNKEVDPSYSVFELPACKYASFEVYVSNGYESENNAMDEWLKTNEEGYRERLLNGVHYCVEYYDERFNGSESGSIVEIWVPIEKA